MKVTRSMKLNECEVDGIYDSAPTESTTVIRRRTSMTSCSTSKSANPVLKNRWDRWGRAMGKTRRRLRLSRTARGGMSWQDTKGRQRQPAVFHPEPERVRRPRSSVLALQDVADEYKVNDEDDPDNDDHFWPPSPKRPRVDEDGLLAEAVLTYAASVGDADDVPTTYQQAMKSNEASE